MKGKQVSFCYLYATFVITLCFQASIQTNGISRPVVLENVKSSVRRGLADFN